MWSLSQQRLERLSLSLPPCSIVSLLGSQSVVLIAFRQDITMSQSWEPLILSLFKSPPKMLSRNLKSCSWLPIMSSLSQCDPNPCKLTLTSQDLSLSEGRENEFGLLQPK